MRALLVAAFALALPAQGARQLRVCATTPDLRSLAEAVLGAHASVTSFVTGAQDPHFVEARPSMVRALHDADLLLAVGLELEVGWLGVLTESARNGSVLPGQRGCLDASSVVAKLGIPQGIVDRSLGDVHTDGNPHYLLDPLCGLQVAAAIGDRAARLMPERADDFARRLQELRERIAAAMVGGEVARLYDHDAEKLALLFANGRLAGLLREQGDLDRLGGWFALLLPHRGAKVVADHDLWPYFARRFGVEVAGFLEPKPGVPPTSRHLEAVIATMQREQVRVILNVPYFTPQHAAFVARATGARVVEMAHQTGARAGCVDYVAMVDHNVRALVAALTGGQ